MAPCFPIAGDGSLIRSSDAESAIHGNVGTGDEGGVVRGEEGDQRGDVLRLAKAAEWHQGRYPVLVLLGLFR